MKKLLFLFFFIAPLQSWSFTQLISGTGQVAQGWSSSTITFNIDTSCNAYLNTVNAAIDNAANIWGHVPSSSLKIVRGSTTVLPGVITNYIGNTANSYPPLGNPIVYCDSNFQADSGVSAASTPGFATGQYVDSDNKINSCLLVLNVQASAAANITTLDQTVVNTVLTHEIGHCIGLGHSADENALMYYATGAGRKTVLAKDDMDGVTFMYPINESNMSSIFPGCAAIASDRSLPVTSRGTAMTAILFELCFLLSVGLGTRRLLSKLMK